MNPDKKIAARYVEYTTDANGHNTDMNYVEDYVSAQTDEGKYLDVRRTVSGLTTMQWLNLEKGTNLGPVEFGTQFIYDYESGKGWESDGYDCLGGKHGQFKETDIKDLDPATLEKQFCDNDQFF